jgi:uncharacterized protein (DUF2237 family)
MGMTATLAAVRVTALYYDPIRKGTYDPGDWVVCVMVGTGYLERHRFDTEELAEAYAATFIDGRKGTA